MTQLRPSGLMGGRFEICHASCALHCPQRMSQRTLNNDCGITL